MKGETLYRTASGKSISIAKIAARTGVSYGAVRKALGAGRNPKMHTALLISRCLGKSLDAIWGSDVAAVGKSK